MNDEQINAVIAEAHGYEPSPMFSCRAWTLHPSGMVGPFVFALPNYCADLNAMREAVLAQPNEFQWQFDNTIRNRCARGLLHAFTARDWAECFVECISPNVYTGASEVKKS